MDREQLVQELDKLIHKREELETSIVQLHREQDAILLSCKQKETDVKKTVNDQVTEDGKKAFTNDLARKTETDRRLSKDEEYQRRQARLAEIKSELDDLSIVLNRVKSVFRKYEILSRW